MILSPACVTFWLMIGLPGTPSQPALVLSPRNDQILLSDLSEVDLGSLSSHVQWLHGFI